MTTTIITKKDIFRDLDLHFVPHPETGAVSVKRNEDAINQQAKNLIMTNKNEVLFQPNIFGGLNEALFNSFDPINVQTIKTAIKDVINNYVDRAKLLNITLTDRLDDYNAIEVSVTLQAINSHRVFDVSFFLERTR